jgi:hypothetical protein
VKLQGKLQGVDGEMRKFLGKFYGEQFIPTHQIKKMGDIPAPFFLCLRIGSQTQKNPA